MTQSNQISPQVLLDTVNQLPCLRISNRSATATLVLQGAQLIEYTPAGLRNLLFVSKNEPFIAGQAIRGGIPVCWPWFGAHSQRSDAPAHGFSRTANWQYEIVSDTDERTDIRLTLSTQGEREDFPYHASAELLVSIGPTLVMSLTTNNLGETAFALSQALHSYFAADDVSQIDISGLSQFPALDKVSQKKITFPAEFTIAREIDWIVLDEGQPIAITGIDVPCRITRMGSRSVVVWNPWRQKAATLSQFHPEEYQRMVCVEPANAGDDARLVKPKQAHAMIVEIAPLISQ